MPSPRRAPGSVRPDSDQASSPDTHPARPPAGNATARNALRLGVAALAIAGAGLVVAVVALAGPGGGSCRTTAWNAVPAAGDLPAGWNVESSQVGVDGLATSLVGPASADETAGAPTIYVLVTCYDADAATALERSRAAADASGQAVTDRSDLGDGGYAIEDASGTTTAISFRKGGLVASVSPSGTVDPTTLEDAASAVAAAVDRAVAGATAPPVAGLASEAPAASDLLEPSDAAAESLAPEPTAAAPELQALLPTEVDGTALSTDSAIGADVLGTDAASRAMVAALATLQRTAADLQIAQAYDETETLDLYLLAFRVPGTPASELAPLVVDTWLSGSSPGVTTSTVTLGGKELTKVSYGDDGSVSYVLASGEAVIVIETSDEALAGTVAGLLP